MNELSLIQLINPAVSIVFAVTFYVLWLWNKNHRYMLVIAIAFVASAIAYCVPQFVFGRMSVEGMMVSMTGYSIGIFLVVSAICHRINQHAPMLLLGLIGLGGVVLGVWATLALPTLNTRLIISNSALGLMFLVGSLRIYRQQRKGPVEWLLLVVLAQLSAQLLIIPHITLSIDGPITVQEYFGSVHYSVMSFVAAVTVVIFALAMIALCVQDSIVRIKKDAQTDSLSGLMIRSAFQEEAENAIFRAQLSGKSVCFLIADIDRLRQVNENYGHTAGDEVIEKFSVLFKGVARKADLQGRVGGEEFCMLLPDTSIEEAIEIATNFNTCLQFTNIKGLTGRWRCKASIGAACLEPGETYIELFNKADKALATAKNKGGNQVCAFAQIVSGRQKSPAWHVGTAA